MRSARKIWVARIAALCVVALLFVWPTVGFAIALAFVAYVAGSATWYQGCQGPSLQRALGFEHGTRYQRVGRRLRSALAVRSVAEGGVFANAGFRSGDVLPEWSTTEFFRHVHRNRGGVVELDVVDGDSEGPAFHARPRRTVRFAVPPAAEVRATWHDLVQGVSVWFPFVFMVGGGAIGHLAAKVAFPAGPPWARVGMVFVPAAAASALGTSLIIVRNGRGTR